MYMKSLIAVLVMLSGAVDALAQTDTITGRVHQLEEVTVTETLRKHTISSSTPLRLLDRQDMRTMG